jgi:hypothetical protein
MKMLNRFELAQCCAELSKSYGDIFGTVMAGSFLFPDTHELLKEYRG